MTGSRHGTDGGNKLRTYKLFKQSYGVENYVTLIMPKSHRSALAKVRCGVAPIRIEIGRYERLPFNERTWFNCPYRIESESPVLLECALYEEVRGELVESVRCTVEHFDTLSMDDRLPVVLSNHSLAKV